MKRLYLSLKRHQHVADITNRCLRHLPDSCSSPTYHIPLTVYHPPRQSTVNGQQSKVGCGSSPTYYLPPTNYLSFQEHSRFKCVTTFVFIDIPASFWAAESWPFVFIDIPASLLHFLKLLQLPLSLTRRTRCPLPSSVQKSWQLPLLPKGPAGKQQPPSGAN